MYFYGYILFLPRPQNLTFCRLQQHLLDLPRVTPLLDAARAMQLELVGDSAPPSWLA